MQAISSGTILVFYGSLALNVGLLAFIATFYTDKGQTK